MVFCCCCGGGGFVWLVGLFYFFPGAVMKLCVSFLKIRSVLLPYRCARHPECHADRTSFSAFLVM